MKKIILFLVVCAAFATFSTTNAVTINSDDPDLLIQEIPINPFANIIPIQITDVAAYASALATDLNLRQSLGASGNALILGSLQNPISMITLYWPGISSNTIIKSVSGDLYQVYEAPKTTSDYPTIGPIILGGIVPGDGGIIFGPVFDTNDSTLVPEPSSSLFLAGGVACWVCRRRKS